MNPVSYRFALGLAALLGLAAPAGCSGGSGAPGPTPTPDGAAPPPPPAGDDLDASAPDAPDVPDVPDGAARPALDLRIEGWFVRALARVTSADGALDGGGWVALLDAPVRLTEAWGRPRRSLAFFGANGDLRGRRTPAPGRELIDFALHPSGELTVLEAASDGWHLARLDRDGAPLGEALLQRSIEAATHDSGRVASVGESVFVGARSEDHAVRAYRVAWSPAGFEVATTTLVVPPHFITPTALHGGSYDTFGQLEAHYGVFVAVDAGGTGYVGVSHQRLENGAMVKAHAKTFGEVLVTDPDYLDAFVTRVGPDGARLGTTVVGTPDDEQLYALRAGAHGAYALGRSERWNAEGTGFDALVGYVDATGAVNVRTFDVARGDIAFDALERGDGSLVVVGASGYDQNPHGASVSETGRAFATVLAPGGGTSPIAVPSGPRHNEARFVLAGPDGEVFVGGMHDGPATHSADRDPSLLRASGWAGRYRTAEARRADLPTSR